MRLVHLCDTAAVAMGVVEAGKRGFRSLYWKLRAEIKRQVSKGRSQKQRLSFHYDAFSYALNFDDASSGLLSL